MLIVVPYTAVEQIAKDYDGQLATKQLVIDVSNPIARRDGEVHVKKINPTRAVRASSRPKLFPGAHLVRGFNAIRLGRSLAERGMHTGRASRSANADDQRRSQGDRSREPS